MPTAIKVEHLSKSFVSQSRGIEKIRALNDVSLEIFSGEILGILGPNGAGKTTFLNILSTILLPDAGTVEIFGVKLIPKNFDYLRTILNLSSGHPNFPWSLTVEENLKFYGLLYGLDRKTLRVRIANLIEMFDLQEVFRQRFDELSSGTKQKLSLAKALLNEPKIIFLDEPTVGLDPDVAIKTREIILDIFKKTKVTILLTTHNMHEAESMCRRIAFIRHGQVLRLASPQELKERQGKKDLEEVFIELAHIKIDKMPVFQSEVLDPKLTQAPSQIPRIGFIKGIALWFQRSFAFTYRNYKFAVRNFFAFVELVFWPIVGLISIGLLGSYLQLQEKALAFVMTGAIASGILQVSQLDVAYSLLYEVWSKSMKHTFLAPVGESEHLFGSWIIGIVRGVAIFFILGVSAIVLFGFKFPSIFVVTVFLLGIFGCALLLGLLVSFLILIFGQKAEITAWMFAYLFMLVCGIYYPIDTLPRFLYITAQFVPITYFLEYFRASFGFEPLLSHSLLKGFGLIGVYLFLGLKMLRVAFYKARRNGVIVRLSE